MIGYQKFGQLPALRHTAQRANGRLLNEYCFTREGFADCFSILYLHHPPTNEYANEACPAPQWAKAAARQEDGLLRRHFKSDLYAAEANFIDGRKILAFNDKIAYGLCHPKIQEDSFFANNDGDELFFLFEGALTIESLFGNIELVAGDYLWLPKSCPYRFRFEGRPRLLYVEARHGLEIPPEYRNAQGQLTMEAPYSERGFKIPQWNAALFESDDAAAIVRKRQGRFTRTRYPDNYFKLAGWDGHVYPVALNLDRIQPKTGRVHLPPSSHMTFSGPGFAVMSFLPRPLDFDANAVPCPFYHSSVDCDELLFYVSGDFTSRRTIGRGSISYHPSGIPHGPHPGAYENAIGRKETEEQAVMVDTFDPLTLTEDSKALEDAAYPESWKENPS